MRLCVCVLALQGGPSAHGLVKPPTKHSSSRPGSATPRQQAGSTDTVAMHPHADGEHVVKESGQQVELPAPLLGCMDDADRQYLGALIAQLRGDLARRDADVERLQGE